jgi:integrase
MMPKAKKLPSGAWRVRVYDGKKDGKQIIKSFTAETKKQAEYLAAVYTMEKKHHEHVGMTLQDAFEKYIESKINILSPATIRDYNFILNRRFTELMPLPLESITNELIQVSINNYARSLSPSTIKVLYGHLSAVLNAYAPDLKLSVTLPQIIKTDKHFLTENDVKSIMNAAENTPLYVPILLAAFGSLRRGEVAALRPSDVAENGINVRYTIVKNTDGQNVRKSPKTIHSVRFVPLPPWIMENVKTWSFDADIDKMDYEFKKITKQLNLQGVTFHSLRHFFAAECHALGIPDKYIMAIGGWSSVLTLQRIYQYAMPDKQTEFTQRALNHFESFND